MKRSIKYSVCFFMALFLLSCNNDELEKNQENAKNAKTELELAKFSNLNIANNVEADFENVSKIEKDNFKILEFSAKEKVVNTFESDVLQNQLKYQGVTIENEGKSKSYFLEVYALAKSAVYPETITNLKDFSGGLNVYSFNGENLGSVVIRNGQANNISGKEDLDILTKAINLFYASSNITSKIPLCDSTYTQTVWQTQDVWRVISQGPKILEVVYVGEKITRTTNILPYPCDGPVDIEVIKLQRMAHYFHYNENGQYLGETSTLNLSPQITDNLTGKAKCINSLLTQNGNDFVGKLLSNFKGASEFNITISSKDVVYNNGVEKNGITRYTKTPGQKDIFIDISTSAISGIGDLEATRVILHEYIHADMYRKLNTEKEDVDASDFRQVFYKYEENQHIAMANLYINSMKQALKDFHKNVLKEDYKKYTDNFGEEPNDEFYEAMCWSGLKDVKAWAELPEEKKASINTIFNNKVRQLSKTVTCQ